MMDIIKAQNDQISQMRTLIEGSLNKPSSQLKKEIVKVKEEYCLKCCEKNDYELVFITEDWYIKNLNKFKILLEHQPDGINIYKKLKRFDEN